MSRRAVSISVSLGILALALSRAPSAHAFQNPTASHSPAALPTPSSSPQQDSSAAAPGPAEPDPDLLRAAEKRFEEEVQAAEARLNQSEKQARENADGQHDQQPPAGSASPAAKPAESDPSAKRGEFGAVLNPPADSGILVRDVHPGTRAEKAGLKSGDVITLVDGRQIHSVSDLCNRLNGATRSQSVRLGIRRGKSRMSILLPPENPPPQNSRE